MSAVKVLRVRPSGFSPDDVIRYRDEVLQGARQAAGEWVYWPLGSIPPCKGPLPGNAELNRTAPAAVDCIHAGGIPCLWRRERLIRRLANWNGRLPAARFLPFDLAAGQGLTTHAEEQKTTASSPAELPDLGTVRKISPPGSRGFHEAELAHISPVLFRTPCGGPLSEACDEWSRSESPGASTPKVSVLVSVYNMQNTLGWTIRSVLAQTYRNWELWIGDDASDDGTVREALFARDQRVHVLEGNANRGKACMMNRLLEQATGRYIMELDGDDWLPPDAIGKLVAAMEAAPLAGIGTGHYGCWFRSRQLGCSWRGCVIPDEEKQSSALITNPEHDKRHRPHPPRSPLLPKSSPGGGGWLDEAGRRVGAGVRGYRDYVKTVEPIPHGSDSQAALPPRTASRKHKPAQRGTFLATG
ncbi:glycosyltransferase family 2 protein [Paenibacillus sp. DMB20]|uniref:glycosyltransferase family 2 protein n=1 Tax=Paenibacillus sp. DMB20 TaxID=1642570 RepID=UPI00069B500A|nr:glycosyltransferase family A protein [Paenibacillus sp. DMB20]